MQRSDSSPQPTSLQMLVSKQNGSRNKVETKRLDFKNSLQVNNCVYSTKNATLHVSAASAVLILCLESCVSSAPSCIPALFFLSTGQGQGGRRPHSSEPHAPEQHQQAACSTRSTAYIYGGLRPPTGKEVQ